MLCRLDNSVTVSLQYEIFDSGSDNPSGGIGWSWEMVITSQIVPIEVLPIFSLLCDGISYFY